MIKVFFRRSGEAYREQHAAAYSLLYAAAAFCGYDADTLEIAKTEEGKPYFKGDRVPFFSLSHSGGYAVCAIGDIPLGVDLERMREIPDRICKRFLGGTSGREAVVRWTMRESYGKLEGGGFFKGGDIPGDVVFRTFDTLPGYLITLCFFDEEAIEEPTEL